MPPTLRQHYRLRATRAAQPVPMTGAPRRPHPLRIRLDNIRRKARQTDFPLYESLGSVAASAAVVLVFCRVI